MPRPDRSHTATVVLDRYGSTLAQEAGIPLDRGTPSPLYRLLCLALLHSAPISGAIAMRATIALADHGLRTPQRMLDAGWDSRVQILDDAGYARVDERTSTMLEEGARLLLDRWHGDLRRLRAEAERRPERIHTLLERFKGIGDVGADIFLREVQGVWEEIAPFADRRALDAARRLGLGEDARTLADLVGMPDLPRLVAGLVRVDRDRAVDDVLAATANA